MMSTRNWFDKKLGEFKGSVDYETEKVILTLTERIVEIMDETGVSRAEMARRLGVSKAFVTKLLNGNPNLTIKSMVSIAIALGCEIDIDICHEGFEVRKFYLAPSSRIIDRSEYTEDFKPLPGGDADAVAA
jgi:transcriptional regulator with XRE-family HTH domain